MAKAERPFLRRDQPVESVQPLFDHLNRPSGHLRVVKAKAAQPVENLEILDRVNVAGDQLRRRPHLRAADRIGGQQLWPGDRLVQIFADGEALRQHRAIDFQRGQQSLWVERQKFRCPLLALAQMMEGIGISDAFQVQRDPHPIDAVERK
jgi:hypothetical protein